MFEHCAGAIPGTFLKILAKVQIKVTWPMGFVKICENDKDIDLSESVRQPAEDFVDAQDGGLFAEVWRAW